jgi:hypothetical protein
MIDFTEEVGRYCIFRYKESANSAWKRMMGQKQSSEDFYPAIKAKEGISCIELVQWSGKAGQKHPNDFVASIVLMEFDGTRWTWLNGGEFRDDSPRVPRNELKRFYHRMGFRGNHIEDVEETIAEEVEKVWSKHFPEFGNPGTTCTRSTVRQFMIDSGRYKN